MKKNKILRKKVLDIAIESVNKSLPDKAVFELLKDYKKANGKTIIISIGKAAWQMAKSASTALQEIYDYGLIITKYNHSKGSINNIKIIESSHPVPDQNSVKSAKEAINLVGNLNKEDRVIFLLSGGGSSLFELPKIKLEKLKSLTDKLLASGASINEINLVRKRLSEVKAGRFALKTKAKIINIVLSDVIGDDLSVIASGPTYKDLSVYEDAISVIEKYNIKIDKDTKKALKEKTPKKLENVESYIIGGTKKLANSAKDLLEEKGYKATILTTTLDIEAKEAGAFFASIAREYKDNKKHAFICTGETTVNLKGRGKGGRNQEMALSCAEGIVGIKNAVFISIGSDGTDGPTDAAGGIVDGYTKENLESLDTNIYEVLKNNDSYNALFKAKDLVFTGPTGTNVNDLSILIID